MTNEAILEQLYALDMRVREARVYLALMQHPEANALMLQRLSGIPRNKIYETLEKMVGKGYCQERIEGRQKFYRAVSPEIIHETLERRRKTEWEQKTKAASEASTNLKELFYNKNLPDRSLDFIEVIRSTEQINMRFVKLSEETEFESISFNRSPYACTQPEILEEQEKVSEDSLGRGVNTRTIYMVEEEYWDWLEEHILLDSAAGEQSLLHYDLPMKMFVFDRKKVMLALPSIPGQSGNDFTMVIIEDPGFTKSCMVLFETYWEKSFTYEDWKAGKVNKEKEVVESI